LGQRHGVRRHSTPLNRLLQRHRQHLPDEAGRRRPEPCTAVARLGAELTDPGVDHLSGQIPEAHRAEQRDDVAANRPGVLVEGGDLDPALLGRQPHLLQELGEGLAGRAHPPVRQRPDVRFGRPLGLERAELLHPPLAGRRVVSAQPDDPLAPLAVDLRLPSLNRSQITSYRIHSAYIGGFTPGDEKSRCLSHRL
jgi:hypothetical protein